MTDLIPKHGGYRKLKSFQTAQLIYDVTVRFCDRYINPFSRTKDQMIQAARSGVQNIAEGSLASATSKKTELKLTQVARASLGELKLDYEDFLRQREVAVLAPDHPVLARFKDSKPRTVEAFAAWVAQERRLNRDEHGQTRADTDTRTGTDSVGALSSACIVANAVLSLLNITCYLLDRQVQRLARDFENKGGFTERLYQKRINRRSNKNRFY